MGTLQERIKSAQKTLKTSFSLWKDDIEVGESIYKFLDADTLAKEYANNLDIIKKISDDFILITRSIRSMRSSYLPIEFFKQIDSEIINQDIASNKGKKESYENTFMRMIGMPALSSQDSFSNSEVTIVSPKASLKIINPITGALEDRRFSEVEQIILRERNNLNINRRFVINNEVFSISEVVKIKIELGDTIYLSNVTLADKARLLGFGGPDNLSEDDIASLNGVTEIKRDSTDKNSTFKNPLKNNEPISWDIINSIDSISFSKKENGANIQNIVNDLYKFCYLLFPPIQDVAIYNSINESEKIITPLFSKLPRKINGIESRPPLLESIIRIRLDRISGTSSLMNTTKQRAVDTNKVSGTTVTPDDYGLLEALFILRLRTAIIALARKLNKDIDNLMVNMETLQKTPATSSTDEGGSASNTPADSAVQLEDIPSSPEESILEITADVIDPEGDAVDPEGGAVNPEGGAVDPESQGSSSTDGTDAQDPDDSQGSQEASSGTKINKLKDVKIQSEKVIEDAIMFILGDNSEVLDLQSQTQRSGSMHNAHMMSGIIDIINVPRKKLSEEIKQINAERDSTATSVLEPKIKDIKTILGMDIGIGTLDLAVFSLGLFTISEDSLLGLLTNAQFDRIKKGEFKTILAGKKKRDTIESINELTLLVRDGYELFKQSLGDDVDLTLKAGEEQV